MQTGYQLHVSPGRNARPGSLYHRTFHIHASFTMRKLDKNRRIIFARFDNDNRYRFIGVYAYPKRIENGYAFSRIATMFDTKRMKIIDSEQK